MVDVCLLVGVVEQVGVLVECCDGECAHWHSQEVVRVSGRYTCARVRKLTLTSSK